MKNQIQSSPKTRYFNEKNLFIDESQLAALEILDHIYFAISNEKFRKRAVKGAYLWGKVGRGKTCLMDIFYHSLNSDYVLRQHFHHFMQTVHQQLKSLAGQPDPLKSIAKKMSQQYKILCFDELFVSDIGDAMLLGKLLQHLFAFKVTLIATSNIAAKDLYQNGLQRERFLPAIQAIITNTHNINLNGAKDHRQRKLTQKTIYFINTNTKNYNGYLLERFKLTPPNSSLKKPLYETVLGRNINYIARQSNTICFNFSALCEGPRSHLDYIEIAKKYQTILLFDIPPLSGKSYERIKARGTEDGSIGSGLVGEREIVLANMDDATRRFIALIDELYDQKIKLFLTSVIELEALYIEGSLLFEFQRTLSRLTEMASLDYQGCSSD